MIILKSTYNRLFELFRKEKHNNLELLIEQNELRSQVHNLEVDLAILRKKHRKLLDSLLTQDDNNEEGY